MNPELSEHPEIQQEFRTYGDAVIEAALAWHLGKGTETSLHIACENYGNWMKYRIDEALHGR